MPPAWSPIAQMKNAAVEPGDWIQFAHRPFCCAMDQHDSNEHVYSTLQVTARPCAVPDNLSAEALLNDSIAFMEENFADFEVVQATSSAIVAGHRANMMRASYTLLAQADDDVVRFSVLSRSFVVFARGQAFTIGLSSSADVRYFSETEFEEIIASVRIGP